MYEKVTVQIRFESCRRLYDAADVGHQATHFLVIISRRKRCCGGISGMLTEKVELLVDIYRVPVEQDPYPEKPVSHVTIIHVCFVGVSAVFSEYHHAGVHDIVLVEHTVVDKKTTVVHCVGRVLFFVGQAIGKLQFRLVHISGVFVDEKTVGKNDRYIAVGRECIYALFEKSGSGDVVAFGNPDVFSPGQFKSFFPLYESRAAVFLVVDNVGYFGVVSVRFDNFPAVIGRTIVENDDFKVAVSLAQYRIYPLIQKTGMTIIGNDYRNIHIESVKKDFTAKIQKIMCPRFLSLFFVRIFAALDNQKKRYDFDNCMFDKS